MGGQPKQSMYFIIIANTLSKNGPSPKFTDSYYLFHTEKDLHQLDVPRNRVIRDLTLWVIY